MKRRRAEAVAYDLPAHLTVGSVLFERDPEAWRAERRDYGRQHRGQLLEAGIDPVEWLWLTREALGVRAIRPRRR